MTNNPVDGVKRPGEAANEGKTPAMGDRQARALLNALDAGTLDELCGLRVKDVQERPRMKHLRLHGEGDKIRFLPAQPAACERIADYRAAAGHGADVGGPVFRPVRNPGGPLDRPLTAAAVYASVVMHHVRAAGADTARLCPSREVRSLLTAWRGPDG